MRINRNLSTQYSCENLISIALLLFKLSYMALILWNADIAWIEHIVACQIRGVQGK